MKDKEKKPHKGESVIGKIIYGFLLFAPLISIGITCLVNVFNNTEQQETTINYKYETNEINSAEDVKIGNIYKVILPTAVNEETNFIIDYLRIQNKNSNNSAEIFENKKLQLLPTTNNTFYIQNVSSNNTNSIRYAYGVSDANVLYIVFNNLDNINILNITKSDYIPIESVETHGINRNETFNYAINQVEQNNLFNWSRNSIIYTGMYEFTQALNVTNTFIPMLLTYWLLISVIYFLYDIVLMLVLIIHNKIHCLQDSI